MPHTKIEKMADMMKTRPGFFCFGCSFPSASCLVPCAVGRGVAGAVGVADGVGETGGTGVAGDAGAAGVVGGTGGTGGVGGVTGFGSVTGGT